MMLMLMVSFSSLAIADDPEEDCYWYFDESNPENECELYCNNTTFENMSIPYNTSEECEECRLEFLDNQTGENETDDPVDNETEVIVPCSFTAAMPLFISKSVIIISHPVTLTSEKAIFQPVFILS